MEEELSLQILNKIQNSDKPIKGKQLCNYFNIPNRQLKKIITKLREEYPIVSKETNGGRILDSN